MSFSSSLNSPKLLFHRYCWEKMTLIPGVVIRCKCSDVCGTLSFIYCRTYLSWLLKMYVGTSVKTSVLNFYFYYYTLIRGMAFFLPSSSLFIPNGVCWYPERTSSSEKGGSELVARLLGPGALHGATSSDCILYHWWSGFTVCGGHHGQLSWTWCKLCHNHLIP